MSKKKKGEGNSGEAHSINKGETSLNIMADINMGIIHSAIRKGKALNGARNHVMAR